MIVNCIGYVFVYIFIWIVRIVLVVLYDIFFLLWYVFLEWLKGRIVGYCIIFVLVVLIVEMWSVLKERELELKDVKVLY